MTNGMTGYPMISLKEVALFQPQFCNQCGDPVEVFDELPTKPSELICPTCNEEYTEGSIFCGVCGQELFCDKCGTVVREGAIFCVSCGDEIKRGELSE